MFSQLPERALTMPDTRQFDASARSARVAELRRLVAERDVADVRAVLIAVAAIDVGIVRLRVAAAPAARSRRSCRRQSSATACSCR